jgi:formylmethanofuran:tetrahydromethanopterin formyltransferase
MAKLSFLRKGWMASVVVLAFLLLAGMNFGTQQEAEFYETEVALENAIAGSGCQNSFGGVCCASSSKCEHPHYGKVADSTWKPDQCVC